MRGLFRLACLLLVLAGAPLALAQTQPPPQRPFSQLVDLWTRQLDRITARIDQAGIIESEIDALREQTADVRAAALAAAQLARNDLNDTKRLLAPLQAKPGADQPPETDAVKAERERLTEQATISESRVKQCEVVIARADQLLERMTKLRSQVVLQPLLQRGDSPVSPTVWMKIGPEVGESWQALSAAFTAWRDDGLTVRQKDVVPLAFWAVLTIVLWAGGRYLRRRFGRGDMAEPMQRDRTLAAAIDGVGLVLVPILAVWLVGKLLAATLPPPPLDSLLSEFIVRLITVLLVVGLTATALAPRRPAWRVLPFTDSSAQQLSTALRRLLIVASWSTSFTSASGRAASTTPSSLSARW